MEVNPDSKDLIEILDQNVESLSFDGENSLDILGWVYETLDGNYDIWVKNQSIDQGDIDITYLLEPREEAVRDTSVEIKVDLDYRKTGKEYEVESLELSYI